MNRVIMYFLASVYCYTLIFVIDLIVNIFSFILNINNLFSAIEEKAVFVRKKERLNEYEKDDYIKGIYEYVYDGFQSGVLKGFPDWNIRTLLGLAMKNWKDDCDGFASLTKFMYPDAKRYAIVQVDIRKIKKNHVVAVRNGKIYSSGIIWDMSLDDYVEMAYNINDVIVLRYF